MPVQPIGLGVRSNPARADVVSVSRLVNCYVEAAGEEGSARLPIYACDGFANLASLVGGGATRAMLAFSVSATYVASGAKLFKVATSGSSAAEIGDIQASGIVTMGRNRRTPNAQIGISAGGRFYVVDNDVLSDVDLSALDTGALVSVLAHHGYFLLLFDNGEFYITSVDSGTTIDPLDFAANNANPDGLIGGAIRGDDVVMLGERSIEFWRDTGATDFPYERAATTGIGCHAAGSIVAIIAATESGITDTVMWAATDSLGAYAGVMMLDGYSGRKISPPELDRLISAEAASAISAFSYTSRGHTFYVISGTNFTWQYDAMTGFWTERVSDGLSRWRISCASVLDGATIVGDYATGAVYTLSPTLSLASDSALTIRQSNDSGATWGATRTITVGGSSDRTQRFKAMRFGQSREDGKVFEFSITNAISEAGTANAMMIVPPHVHAWPNRVEVHALYVDVVPGSSQNSRPKAVTRAAVDVTTVGA